MFFFVFCGVPSRFKNAMGELNSSFSSPRSHRLCSKPKCAVWLQATSSTCKRGGSWRNRWWSSWLVFHVRKLLIIIPYSRIALKHSEKNGRWHEPGQVQATIHQKSTRDIGLSFSVASLHGATCVAYCIGFKLLYRHMDWRWFKRMGRHIFKHPCQAQYSEMHQTITAPPATLLTLLCCVGFVSYAGGGLAPQPTEASRPQSAASGRSCSAPRRKDGDTKTGWAEFNRMRF